MFNKSRYKFLMMAAAVYMQMAGHYPGGNSQVGGSSERHRVHSVIALSELSAPSEASEFGVANIMEGNEYDARRLTNMNKSGVIAFIDSSTVSAAPESLGKARQLFDLNMPVLIKRDCQNPQLSSNVQGVFGTPGAADYRLFYRDKQRKVHVFDIEPGADGDLMHEVKKCLVKRSAVVFGR